MHDLENYMSVSTPR